MRALARSAAWKALRRFHPVLHRAGKWVLGPLELRLSERPRAFDDRSRGCGTVLMILAGYKPALWPRTFERIARHTVTDDVDVCIVCSGLAPAAAEARHIAAERGWSFLQVDEDLLAHAQNMAVRSFPRAEWIAKLDEDMFVTEGWLERLHETYERAKADRRYEVGLVAPLIPVNGFGYRVFLDMTGALGDYDAAFPEHPPLSAGFGVAAQMVPEVAEWLWRRSSPLDEVAQRLSASGGEYSVCPHRFSIGAFLMRREVFEAFEGFAIAPVPGTLGYEESRLCRWCSDMSHAIVVAHSSLVGHFAFGPQWDHMNTVLQREPALFD